MSAHALGEGLIVFNVFVLSIVLRQEPQLTLHLLVGELQETSLVVVLLTLTHHPLEEMIDVGIEIVVGEANVLHRDEVDVFTFDEVEGLVKITRTERLTLTGFHTQGQQSEFAAESTGREVVEVAQGIEGDRRLVLADGVEQVEVITCDAIATNVVNGASKVGSEDA